MRNGTLGTMRHSAVVAGIALVSTIAVTESACGDDAAESAIVDAGGGDVALRDADRPDANGDAAEAAVGPCGALEGPTVTTTVPGAAPITPTGFEGGTTPQLDLSGPDVSYTWNDPHVLRVGSEYWMFASATVAFDFPVRIYRLVSSDGITWKRSPAEPVFEPGAPGTWEAGGVETPAVVFFGGRYHLFYTAYATEIDQPGHSPNELRIGHAISCDGVTWTRVGSTPMLAPSGTDSDPTNDFYAFVVAEPGPVVVDGKLHLYFTAIGASAALGTSLGVIGVMTSADAITWSKPELALEPDQTQYPRIVDAGPPKAGWPGYSTPNAIVLDDSVHLSFDVAYDPDEAHWAQVRLHHAVSPNGRTSWTQDSMPIARASDFEWTKNEIRAPHALIDGTTLRLYFAGHELDAIEPNHFGIGMLTQKLASP